MLLWKKKEKICKMKICRVGLKPILFSSICMFVLAILQYSLYVLILYMYCDHVSALFDCILFGRGAICSIKLNLWEGDIERLHVLNETLFTVGKISTCSRFQIQDH